MHCSRRAAQMETNKLPLGTRLHTDARRPRDLSCRSAFSWSVSQIFDIRRPGCAAGGDIEANIARLPVQKRKSISALMPNGDFDSLSISRRAVMKPLEDTLVDERATAIGCVGGGTFVGTQLTMPRREHIKTLVSGSVTRTRIRAICFRSV